MLDIIKKTEQEIEEVNKVIDSYIQKWVKKIKYQNAMNKKRSLTVKLYKLNHPHEFMNKSQQRIYIHYKKKWFSKEEALKKANALSTM